MRNRPAPPPRLSSSWKHRFWAALHVRALKGPLEPLREKRWLCEFTRRIPCGGCRRHWKEILDKLPPDLASGPAYFRWTVRAHNEINRLLGKRLITVALARSIWRQAL